MSLVFPSKILEQHLVVLGKTGAGKSSALRYIVEHLLANKKRVCILDPKGDWWGLKFSADGKSAGLPVIAFGDFKESKAADVPLNAESGKHVGELISSGNRPCVIGFRGWFTSHMIKFWIDFASTVFNANSGELFIVGDEFHNFAPKGKIMDPESGKCLHWSNRLLSEGRGLGIVCLLASQRPQKVHNDTLTSCETLVAMRVIHEADRQAVKVWIDGCGDKVQGNQVLNTLAGMPRGEAWVWSPEVGFGPKQVAFPMFETFDSFAPPQTQKKVSAQTWETVDLDQVRSKLSAVIEERKANDPAELKRTVADLKRKLAEAERKAPEAKPIEVPVLDSSARLLLTDAAEACQSAIAQSEKTADRLHRVSGELERLQRAVALMTTALNRPTPSPSRPMNADYPMHPKTPRSWPRAASDPNTNGEVLGGGLRRMLIALAQRQSLSKRQLGVRAGLSSTSGTFGTYLAKLRSNGWIDDNGDSFRITQSGLQALGRFDPLPEGQELLNYWLRELGASGAARMLQVLASVYPTGLGKAELGEQAQISHTSGTFGTYLAKLRTLELVEGGNEIRASKEFFE